MRAVQAIRFDGCRQVHKVVCEGFTLAMMSCRTETLVAITYVYSVELFIQGYLVIVTIPISSSFVDVDLRVKNMAAMALEAKRWLETHLPYWRRRGGADHVWLFSHDEGPCWAPMEIWNTSIILSHWGRKVRVLTCLSLKDHRLSLRQPCHFGRFLSISCSRHVLKRVGSLQ